MNEKSHAWLIACFYRYYTQQKAERGRESFIVAARRYGEERGRRMALRALRDGWELNFAAYLAYSEWRPTDPGFYDGVVVSYTPDYENHNRRCPWAETFAACGQPECGTVYCQQIDAALVRGFNADLRFELLNPLLGHDCCRMVFRDALLDGPEKPAPRSSDTVRPFTYHCGHLYHVFSDVAEQVFGLSGVGLSRQVLSDFAAQFGEDKTNLLCHASQQDFCRIDA